MLVLWRVETEQFPGHIQGLATSFKVARELAEGVPNVFATDYIVDEEYAVIDSYEDLESDWIQITDEHGIWMKW